MKFSGKMCFEIILKVTKNEGCTLFIEDTFFKKPRERVGKEGGGQFDPPRHIRVTYVVIANFPFLHTLKLSRDSIKNYSIKKYLNHNITHKSMIF